MDITVYPGKLKGTVAAIPSKSHAHRVLICAALSDKPTAVQCYETNHDIETTVDCLNAIGADIQRTAEGYFVKPAESLPSSAVVTCGESGSTLRFLLPIVCALGIDTTIHMSGRLPYRPILPLMDVLNQMGCSLSRPTDCTIHTSGKLIPGTYTIVGNVSSQFISGLLMALPLLDGESSVCVKDKLESAPYVQMTQAVLATFGISTDNFAVHGCFPFRSPGYVRIEGDWSNAAFFLTASALGSQVVINNLNCLSCQGDRIIMSILENSDDLPVISAANIPDLIPILAVYFATKNGVLFKDISRLRLKESDRILSVCALLHALGIETKVTEHTMRVFSGSFKGGIVDSCGDHRIAMAAGIAATVASSPVTIFGAECVAKSYPAFWQEYTRLGGKYEQYLR